MYDVSVVMGLVDYIPVILFGITAWILQKDLYGRMCRGTFALFAAGTIEIFTAGFLKATWKLLYAAGVCDFEIFNHMMMPLQSLGWVLTGVSLIIMLSRKGKCAALAVPPVFSGSMVFVGMMVLGLGTVCACLGILAVKLKKKLPVVLFVLSFVFYMGMGYMASRDSTTAAVNWIEQSLNCAGQALLLGGVWMMHKAGLAEKE